MSRRTKGEGTIRKRSDGRWEGRFVNCIGETKSVYGQSKVDVRRKLQEITYNTNSKVFRQIRGDIELDIWYEHYIEIKKRMIKARSLNQIQLAYNTHISPVLGDIIMSEITPNDIANFLTILERKNLSKKTISNILTHARAMFKFAAEEGVIAKSPFLYIKIDTNTKTMRRNLTGLEIEHILEVSRSLDYTMYLMICTMLYTGIRPGELCGLRWNDFDTDFTYLRIDESITDHKYENSTKTESSKRIIPLITFLQTEFKEFFCYQKPDKEDFVFLNRFKQPFRTENIDKKFRYIRSCVMSIYPNDDISDITPHCFRHTFTTNGIASGVSIKNMQMLLGHADTRTLLETYMHVNFEDKKTSIDIIEKNLCVALETNSEKELESKWTEIKRFKGAENYKKELNKKIV